MESDQGLQSPLAESLASKECVNGEQTPRRYFAHVLDDLNLRILCMFEGIFSLDAAKLKFTAYN